MADEIDLAQEREHIATTSALNQVREQAARIEPGAPGECELCGALHPGRFFSKETDSWQT